MTKPEALGFSSDRLRKLDAFLAAKYVEPGLMPCAQVQIVRKGELVHQTVLGHADRERGLKAAEDTVYRIYSMTKPITSLAFMMLVEEGAVALDDPVSRFIPEWKALGVYAAGTGPYLSTPPARPMQMVDLLRHTSGLTYDFQSRTNIDAAYRKAKIAQMHGPLDFDGTVAELAKIPLEFSPGEAWNYSISTDILGILVERISGQKFQDFLAERIFKPLGMSETGFQVQAHQRARFAACYNAVPGGLKLQDDPATSVYHNTPSFHSGGGGLVSTAHDYMRFCKMLANGGELDGARLIAPRTLKLMASNHLPGGQDLTHLSRSLFSEATNAGVGFGLGFAVTFDPVKAMMPSSPGEFYWGGAASTAFWIDPVEDICVVFMTQLMPSSTYPIRRELRTLVYSALMDPSQ